MHTTIVHVHVRPESLDAFIEACRLNHEASVREPGNRRFDVLQMVGDPARFVLHEACAAADDAAAHKQTAHKQTAHDLAWRDMVAGMMAEPRQGMPYAGLFPAA